MLSFYKNISAKQSIQILIAFRLILVPINIYIGSSNSGNINTIIISFLIFYFLFKLNKIAFKYIWLVYASINLFSVYIYVIHPFIQTYFTDIRYRIYLAPDNQLMYIFIFFDIVIYLMTVNKIYKYKLD